MNSIKEMVEAASKFLDEELFSSIKVSYQTCKDKDYLKVARKDSEVSITYGQLSSLFRGLTLVKEKANEKQYEVEFHKHFDTNCWMIDVSRNAVMKPSQVKKIIMIMALFGLNRLMLYTEDTFQLDNKKYPYFGYLRGAYSIRELQDLDEYAASLGVELVPCIETLDHLGRVMRWDAFNNIQDGPSNINPGEEETYVFIEELIKTCRKCYKTNIIHVGMDESMNLGLGKYLLKNRNNVPNQMELFNKHLQRVIDICKKYNFRPIIWSDMFFRLIDEGGNYYTNKQLTPEIIDMIPKDVDLVYWDYYHDDRSTYEVMLKKHQQTHNPVAFAGGAWNWATLAPFTKLAKNRSIIALEVMVENKVKDVMVTTWGDFGAECSNFAALSSLAVYSEFDFLGRHDQTALESLFEAVTGEKLSSFHLLDTPNEPEHIAKVGEFNCGRYYFYQDPLLGLFDSTVKESYKKKYLSYLPLLEKAIKESVNYKYLYQYTYDLLSVLVDKVDLGVNLRKYYKENKLDKLQEIKDVVLPRLMENIAKFERTSEYRWRKENRSFGYEVIDGRIGFLKNRLNSTYRLLEEYLSKKIDHIEELEAELLPYSSKTPDDEFGVAPWIYNVSPCEV